MANYTIAINTATTLFAGQLESASDTNVMRVNDKVMDFSGTTLPGGIATASDTLDLIALAPETLVDRGFIQVMQASSTSGNIYVGLVAPATALVNTAGISAAGYTMGSVTTTGGIVPTGTNSTSAFASGIYGTSFGNTPGGTTVRANFSTTYGNGIYRVGVITLDVSALVAKFN